ncbi:hypothetical protein NUW58_g9325 [Xylaria curta]|uniref:Uncharacterized protein n=1 Tax=Xylaria curta TaxID=42375 RepID=A0ACC1MZY6_9PEZI|nr:hypothetical protein NUW58_g9325 [Xylaria curta]
MAASVPPPASPPFTGCGNVTSLEGDRAFLMSTKTLSYRIQKLHIASPRSIMADMGNTGAASAEVNAGFASPPDQRRVPAARPGGANMLQAVIVDNSLSLLCRGWDGLSLDSLPNEILMQILGLLDVSDLLTTSRSEFTETSSSPRPSGLSSLPLTRISLHLIHDLAHNTPEPDTKPITSTRSHIICIRTEWELEAYVDHHIKSHHNTHFDLAGSKVQPVADMAT